MKRSIRLNRYWGGEVVESMTRGLACAAALLAALGLALARPALAADEEKRSPFLLGEETKGATVKVSDDAFFNVRLRLQPRVDFGDILVVNGQRSTESDFYLRRVRFETSGQLYKNLTFNFTVDADRTDQGTNDNQTVRIHYAWGRYAFSDAFRVRFGRDKLPFSRIELVSSARQLLIDRPTFADFASTEFGEYRQTHVLLDGRFGEGVLQYAAAVLDGSRQNQANTANLNVASPGNLESGPGYIGRIVLSPPGWVEPGSMSDAHLGRGKHLALGVNYGRQDGEEPVGIAGPTIDRQLAGADLSLHFEGLTLQAEAIAIRNSQTASPDFEPQGWYVQGGYFIPGINVEPAARYEVFDRNANGPGNKDKIFTAGLNWYLKGHSFKVSANYVHIDVGSENLPAGGDRIRNVYQIQSQIYF